jgi:hypothetical protein
MKTRQGFVSNSSTSSFMIYGYEMDAGEFRELVKKKHSHLFDKELAKLNKDREEKLTFEEAMDGYAFYDLEETLRDNDIPIHMIDGDYDTAYLGVDPSSMDMDETKRQFQARVEEQIKKFVGKKVKCSYIDHDYSC